MFIEGRGYDLYSEELKELIDKSELLAVKTQVKEVEPVHLFYCLISNDTAARNILIYMGINQKKLMETTKKGVLALQSDSPLKKNRGESAEPSRATLICFSVHMKNMPIMTAEETNLIPNMS